MNDAVIQLKSVRQILSLANACMDSAELCVEAASAIADPSVCHRWIEKSRDRRLAVHALVCLLPDDERPTQVDGTMAGAAFRVMMTVTRFMGGGEKEVFAAIEDDDRRLMEAFRSSMRDDTVQDSLRAWIAHIYEGLSLDEAKASGAPAHMRAETRPIIRPEKPGHIGPAEASVSRQSDSALAVGYNNVISAVSATWRHAHLQPRSL